MKDNLPFFSHDNNARNHPKMKALIAEFGYEGYGRFWALNERIAESAGAFIDISRKVYKLDLAKELGLDGNGLDKFISFLSDPDIDLINFQNGIITTDRITELFSQTMEKREEERNKKRGKKGKSNFPDGKEGFPEGIQGENKDFPAENNTYKTRQDNTKQNDIKQEKNNTGFFSENSTKTISDPPPDQPSKTKDDAMAVFNKARSLWNERVIKPQCRDVIIPQAYYGCLQTIQNYSWLEIENAIKNYHYHVTREPSDGWAQPPPYGSIYGFLEKGVLKYFDDAAFKELYGRKDGGRR
jgi:hypothetical protein